MIVPIRDVSQTFCEPTLDEILSDSIVQAVMRADVVDPNELRAELHKIAHARRAAQARLAVGQEDGQFDRGHTPLAMDKAGPPTASIVNRLES
jgi:hypothetical protein